MADDPVLVVDRRVLDVMVEVLERLRVEDDDGDRLPDLAVLPVQKLGHEIGIAVGRFGERRRLAPAEALAVAPEDPELHPSRLSDARQHGKVPAAVGRPLLGDHEDLGGAVGLRREPSDRRGLRVGEPRDLVRLSEVSAPVTARLALRAFALEVLGGADIGDVLVEGEALDEPRGCHHALAALHGVLLWLLETDSGRNSSTGGPARRPRLAAGVGGEARDDLRVRQGRQHIRGGPDLRRAAPAAEDDPLHRHELVVHVDRNSGRQREDCDTADEHAGHCPRLLRGREGELRRAHQPAHGVVDVEPMSSTGSSRGARYHECDALDACASLRLPSAGTRMASNLGDKFSTLHEIVRAARNNLAPGPWDYLIGGAETETTVRRNRLALDSIAFRPRVLRDVSKIDTTSTFFGRPVRIPVMLAPIGSIETFAEGGGATAAKASEEFGVPQMLSSVCNPGLEAVAAAANNFRVFQLYVRGDDAWVDDWVRRAVDHGYAAFCLTVDTACYSRRERDLARRFVKPWRTRAGGFEFQAGLSWDHVKRFQDTHSIPLVLKGIATAEDATLATDHGVEGVYVSNHGGRQLDHGRGAIDALPEVVRAVGGRATVIVDGGFVRGTDVVKALALGARCVGIGRLACCGLAAAGQAGLVRVLELLEDEIKIAMGLLGVDRLAALDPSYLHSATPVNPPHETSAFPLLDEEGY